jgi:hypothetical protein
MKRCKGYGGDGVSLMQLANYNSFEGVLYCRPHFDQLFKRTGSLDKSFEGTDRLVSFIPFSTRQHIKVWRNVEPD